MNSLKWINTIAFIAMVAVNAAANIIPIGGNTTADVSKSYLNLFTPTPITFAIWGVIYFFMALFVIYQWGFMDRNNIIPTIRDRIGFWFIISCILNIAWIFAWHLKKIELSTILIVLLLISLIFIVKRIPNSPRSFWARIMVKAGFDIYFGWIIAATIANISVLLTKLNWNMFGLSEQFWLVIVLLAGACIAGAVVLVDFRWLSGIATMWAYFGIMAKHISPNGYAGKYVFAITAGTISILYIFGTIVYKTLNIKKKVLS